MANGRRGLMLVLGMAFAALSRAQTGISVTVDGQPLPFAGTGPQMVNGRVLVPLRGIFERLGAYVQWNPSNRTVVATRGQNSVSLQIGNPNATVDGRAVTLDVPAQIVANSTMVPIRFVSESLGAQVLWHATEEMVVILSGQSAAAPPPVEDTAPPPPEPVQGGADTGGGGPVRMARISWQDGDVTWRPDDGGNWCEAGPNLPLRQGAELWLNGGARSEIQFDDGSALRLGNGALATLQTMFSDDQGEFTEICQNTGRSTLHLTNQLSTYQVDTPLASVKATGPANIRIDDTNGCLVIVRDGQAVVQGPGGQVTLNSGDSLNLLDSVSPFAIVGAPGEDSWDQLCAQRDEILFSPSPNLPSNIALVAGGLDSYGTWIDDPQYGRCWSPSVSDPGWAPYQNGHWVWVNPFGWTWCGSEAWGWAPYHYGTWFRASNGWAWRPGPAQQYWSPAIVQFSTLNGSIAWCPLAPAEVRYPAAISVGLRVGNWSLNFSIGGAASYCPAGPSYCTPRPWNSVAINRAPSVINITQVTNIQNVYASNNGFVPRNSRVAGGATMTTASGFASGGHFSRVSVANQTIFTKGRTFAPPSGARPAGPMNVRPTAASFSPTHTMAAARPNATIVNRSIVRAPLPARAASLAKPIPRAKTLPRTLPDVTARARTGGGAAPRNPLPRNTLPTNPRTTPKRPAVPGRPAAPVRPAPTRPTTTRPVPPVRPPANRPVVPPVNRVAPPARPANPARPTHARPAPPRPAEPVREPARPTPPKRTPGKPAPKPGDHKMPDKKHEGG